MNWQDFKIETETAYCVGADKTATVNIMKCHRAELSHNTLLFYSHNTNGYEYYYRLFEGLLLDLLQGGNDRANFCLSGKENNDGAKIIDLMADDYFTLNGLTMQGYEYNKQSQKTIYKVIVHRTYDEYLDVPAINEEQALEIARKALNGEQGYEYDEYLYHTIYDYEPDWIDHIKIELHDLQDYEVYDENI